MDVFLDDLLGSERLLVRVRPKHFYDLRITDEEIRRAYQQQGQKRVLLRPELKLERRPVPVSLRPPSQ